MEERRTPAAAGYEAAQAPTLRPIHTAARQDRHFSTRATRPPSLRLRTGGQVVMHLVERDLRLAREPDLPRIRADLLLREALELLLGLPNIDDADPVAGLGRPVEDPAGRTRPPGG